jgi:hypothetical protein
MRKRTDIITSHGKTHVMANSSPPPVEARVVEKIIASMQSVRVFLSLVLNG